jgi:hypothetical protein
VITEADAECGSPALENGTSEQIGAALAVSSPAAQNVAGRVSLTTSWSPERFDRFTSVKCDDIDAADLRAPRLLDEEVADGAFGAANRDDDGGDEPA